MTNHQDTSTERDLVARMRSFEVDHEPDGWPAVRMREISALCDEIERLRAALASRDEVAPSDFPPEKVPAQQTQDPDRLRIRFEDRFGALFGTDRHADNGEYVEPDTNAAWLVYSAVAERQGPEIGAVTGEFLYSRWWGFYSTIMNAKGENLDGPYYQFSELPEPVQRAHNMLAEELHAAQQPQGQAVSDEQIASIVRAVEDKDKVPSFSNGFYTLTPEELSAFTSAILALRDGPTIKDSLTVERVPLSEDWATIAGLESAVYHLSTLVDQQRALLAESEDVFGRDGHGGRYEDGECGLIDRIRAHLEMTAPPPKGITAKEQGNGN